MLPAVASNVAFIPPQQAPLVNTAILGSDVTRVPSFNVAPSVSNAQVDNNTKGNSNTFARATTPDITDSNSEVSFTSPSATRPAPFIALPTTFLAQLLGQNVGDTDLVTQGILIEYERLLALSDVKYKPSNALKPLPDPSGAFGSILGTPDVTPQETVPTEQAAQTQPVSQPQAPVEQSLQQIQAAPQATPQIKASTPEPRSTQQPAAPQSRSGVSAYIATGQRNETIDRKPDVTSDTVSDLA